MAKTKVKVKNVNKVVALIKETFEDTKKSKQLLDRMGLFVADRIRSFARSGKTLVSGKPKDFPALSPATIQFRQDLAESGIVDPIHFNPNRKKSNITLTGDLVRAIKSKIIGDELLIFLEENRRDGQTNKKVVGDLLKINKGYAFMGLDDKGIARLKKLVLDELRRENRRNNLKK